MIIEETRQGGANMEYGNTIKRSTTVLYPDGHRKEGEMTLISEHLLTVSVNGEEMYRLVCTRDRLKELVAGRLLTDGLIKKAEDIEEISFDQEEKNCLVVAGLKKEKGREMLPDTDVDTGKVFALADEFASGADLHNKTGATHICILSSEGKAVFTAEDIGRHNAVDKVVGFAALNGIDRSGCMLFISGRVPVDMVEKVIAAGIPVLVSKSVPTAESVELAKEYGLKLICRAWPDKCELF
ncbi:MAG: formate dehydrogenase accessory sulfurtransferase FdhD [Clostridiales bacterium]|nr:formate dehydrogenase accessory sulfurtransferase FdhD [Clostridiales bacterium]